MTIRSVRDERGATLVEHAIALPIFLFFLIISIEFLRVSYYALSLQYTASAVMRDISLNPPTGQGDLHTRATQRLRGFAIKLDIPGSAAVTLCPVGQYNTGSCPIGSYNPGTQFDLMALSIRMRIRDSLLLHFVDPVYTIEGLVVGRNEPREG